MNVYARLIAARLGRLYRGAESFAQHPAPGFVTVLMTLSILALVGVQLVSFARNPTSTAAPEASARAGDTRISWTWNSGADKPLIKWSNDTQTEISAWTSTIETSPGISMTLWDHYMGLSTSTGKIFASYLRPDWYLLEQEIEAIAEDRVAVSYYFTPHRSFDSVTLTLRHYRGDWNSSTRDGNVITLVTEDRRLTINGEGLVEDVDIVRERSTIAHIDITYTDTLQRMRHLIAKEIFVTDGDVDDVD